jgi:hypothetical protein
VKFGSKQTKFINTTVISVLAFICVIVGAAVWYQGGAFESADKQQVSDNNMSTSTKNNTAAVAAGLDNNRSVSSSAQKKFTTTEKTSGPNRFVSKPYGFSFQYPQDFSVSAFDDRGGHVVLVRSADSKTVMQIFITNWDEPTDAVTPERIKQDLPNLTIRNARNMSMSGDSRALTFVGESDKFGRTREVWFARRGNLYQIIAPVQTQEFVGSLLETWKFR